MSNLNSNYKEIRNAQQLQFLRQNTIKKSISIKNNDVEIKKDEVIKKDTEPKLDEIYTVQDQKKELEDLLKELSINRNKKKK
jgi:hypothetical protein